MLLSHAFGPGDITCVAIVPGAAYVIEEAIDASYSEHVDKLPVRRLGHRLPVGFASGMGTFAGTIVCAQLTQGAFWKVRRHFGLKKVLGDRLLEREGGLRIVEPSSDFFASVVSVTQLPPIHLMWVHTNEQGQMAIARWYDVVFSDRGTVLGASNAYVEQTLQYQCLMQEEIRLHRSMTVAELQALGRRTMGFFSDYYRRETLVESLQAIADELGSQDLLEYLLGETALVESRQAQGQVTSISLFDTGRVLFELPEQQPAFGDYLESRRWRLVEKVPVLIGGDLRSVDVTRIVDATGGLVRFFTEGGRELIALPAERVLRVSGGRYAQILEAVGLWWRLPEVALDLESGRRREVTLLDTYVRVRIRPEDTTWTLTWSVQGGRALGAQTGYVDQIQVDSYGHLTGGTLAGFGVSPDDGFQSGSTIRYEATVLSARLPLEVTFGSGTATLRLPLQVTLITQDVRSIVLPLRIVTEAFEASYDGQTLMVSFSDGAETVTPEEGVWYNVRGRVLVSWHVEGDVQVLSARVVIPPMHVETTTTSTYGALETPFGSFAWNGSGFVGTIEDRPVVLVPGQRTPLVDGVELELYSTVDRLVMWWNECVMTPET